ncbi:MAG TPA: MipA/OmpV family protein [Pseudomonas sp.]|nr:MipA/OmpV family protein [Pseudomonas sp.]
MTNRQFVRPFTLPALALLIGTPTSALLAQEQEHEDASPWRISLGLGAMHAPEYLGSGESESNLLPLVSVRYKRFFLGGMPGSGLPGPGLGAYLYESDTFTLGAVLTSDLSDPREESDDERLRGLGDIEATTRTGLFGSYRADWLTLSASVLSDIGGHEQGTTVSLDAKATYRPLQRLQLSAGPGITWGSGDYMQTFFGIDQSQAAHSAYAPYEVGSGVSLLRFSVGAQYQLADRWALGGNLTAARLQGDAADSPIVEDRNQNSYALFLMYRF